jgi:hypothetical protein
LTLPASPASDALVEPADPILLAMEKEAPKPVKEATRPYPFRRCNWDGHVWGMAIEDWSSLVPVDRRVCIRGRGSIKGRCPAFKAWTVPDPTPLNPEETLPEFFLPVSETLRLRRHDWGSAAHWHNGAWCVCEEAV